MNITKTLIFALSITVFNVVHIVKGLARFTKVPQSVLYVSVGKTAQFVWDYTVEERQKEFLLLSPKWSFYGPNNSKSIIALENAFEQRQRFININTCPKRLLSPTRVGIESNATLVIQNVTVADSGTYGCSLELTTGSTITSKVKLIVTTLPKITLTTTNTSTIKIKESDSLDIRCSATGNPAPNITWVGMDLRNVTSQGVRNNATLRINNITKHQGGRYQCRASNNPNEAPVTMDIEIIVLFTTESPRAHKEDRNKPITYLVTKRDTLQASTQVIKPKRRKHNSTKLTPIVGGFIGVGLLMAIAIGLTLFVIVNKKKGNAKNKLDNKYSNGNRFISSNQDRDTTEVPMYAEIDTSMGMKNQPIYAQVDKSKKKRPGQIIYTELEDFKRTGEMPSAIFPPAYKDTEYAAIQGLSEEENNEPIYEGI